MADYITKSSGSSAEYSSGMVRDSQDGKPRFDLLLPSGVPYADQMLTRWAALMTRGGERYGARNWEHARTAEELERYKSSALRHMMQWQAGETDEDHAAAVMFNLMAAEYVAARIKVEVDLDQQYAEYARLMKEEADAEEPPTYDHWIDSPDIFPHGYVDDGLGNMWDKCSPTCDMQVIRPGDARCSCRDSDAGTYGPGELPGDEREAA